MTCQHCNRKLTPINTFGDPGETFCQDCFFELLDLRIELRDAKTELSHAAVVVSSIPTTDKWTAPYYKAIADRAELASNITALQTAIEKFNRYAKETHEAK